MKAVAKIGAVLLMAIVVAVVAGTASARSMTAPTILGTSVVTGRHLQVSWALPQDGSTSFIIEVATNPSTGGTGEFFTENVVAEDFLANTQTSWTDANTVPPGTYYVHVSDSNLTCVQVDTSDCFAQEWSSIATVVAPGITGVHLIDGTTCTACTPVANRAKAGALFFADLGVDKVGEPNVTGSCIAKVAGKRLAALEKAFNPDGVWICVWRIPKTATGTVTGKISVSDGTTAFARQFAVHIKPLPKKL